MAKLILDLGLGRALIFEGDDQLRITDEVGVRELEANLLYFYPQPPWRIEWYSEGELRYSESQQEWEEPETMAGRGWRCIYGQHIIGMWLLE